MEESMNIWFQILALFKAIGVLTLTKPLVILFLLISIILFTKMAEPLLIQWRYEKEMLDNKKMILKTGLVYASSVTAGDISVENNIAPTQINVGSPGSMQIVNQQRKILPKIKLEKGKKGNNYLLRIVLTQTSGIWNQGTDFRLQIQTTGPFESSRIVKGLPPVQFNVRTSENKEQGYYAYATSTAPINDEPIILEIVSKTEIDVSQVGINPLQQ